MPLDPGIQQMLTVLETMGNPPLSSGTPESARQGFRMLTVDLRPADAVVPVGEVSELTLPGPAGPLPARVYRPDTPGPGANSNSDSGPVPTILFIHGGGFVIGDLDTHDNQCRTICRDVGAVVLSIGYRLAPETPFPAAVQDCRAALEWTAAHIDELGGDPDRLAVAGDSAGGNLAAVMARLARDRGGPSLAAQLLIYPGTDFRDDDSRYPSRKQNADGYFLTLDDMHWFREQYVGTADPSDPSLSPLLAEELSGLPPAVVVTAEFDPLRDEGEAYAQALSQAGVKVIAKRYDGLIHGFFDLTALSPAAAGAIHESCASLRQLLS